MDAGEVARLFTRADGTYLCARWGRPVVPVVFGVDDATLATMKGAIEAMVAHVGHKMAETDPELGANLMIFFFSDWSEVAQVPNLERLVPGLAAMCDRLAREEANQYRMFRFDAAGAIKAVFVFLRVDRHLLAVPAASLALMQAARVMLSWSDRAFAEGGLLVRTDTVDILHPEVAKLLRAAYDPLLPLAARDAAHALRLAARMAQG